MPKVKIYGAGSIGNHLAHASRHLGWDVHLCDIDNDALERTKTKIYPERYGQWDEQIQLYNINDIPSGDYDYIFIGTPPDSHLELALQALQESPQAILIEKPLCTPKLENAKKIFELSQKHPTKIFVGYNHIVSKAFQQLEEWLTRTSLENIVTIDVEFREHWQGIFNAHPWLDGPSDTYLGYWEKGGGACGEHSHATSLWQHLAHQIGAGRIIEVMAMMQFVKDGNAYYDCICSLNFKTESGLIGRTIQDVVTSPARKWGRIQAKQGAYEFHIGYQPGIDILQEFSTQDVLQEIAIQKTRPDDFIEELQHIEKVLNDTSIDSGISLQRGLDTMLVIAAAYLSAKEHRAVRICYDKGYVSSALELI